MTDLDVGSAEVAAMLHVDPHTVSWWRREKMIPEPATQLKSGPVWRRDVIVKWAKETGRWPHE